MEKRKQQLLDLIIKEHIKTAQPIGSKLLVDKSGISVSSATVRNEMADLEKQGFIYQPHTSAGRVPTEKGYRYFIDNFIDKKELSATEQQSFKSILQENLEHDTVIKNIAKKVVDISRETVIVAFENNNIYYTGLSNLFSKPEFSQQECVFNLSKVIDHLDDRVQSIFDQIDSVQIAVGKENPFGSECSAIMGKYKLKNNREGLFIILSPMRTDYEKNVALVEYIQHSLTTI